MSAPLSSRLRAGIECAPWVIDEVKRLEARLAEKPRVPEGYALIGIDALKAWGVHDQVRDACRYPVAQQHETVTNDEQARAYMDARLWEFIDMAGMWPKAKPDPRIWAHVMVYAPPAQQPQKLEDVEQYRMQMAGISTAAMGYWKEGDSIHPDYDTPALRDVAKLYAKYDALYKAHQPSKATLEKLREWETGGELIDRAWSVLQSQEQEIMRLEKMLAEERAQQPQAEPHKPLFADLIAQHPGLREELLEMDEQPQAESVQYTRADLDRAYSAGLVEGERLAIQQAEAVPPGYVLVPVQPTPEMVREGASAARSYMQETGGNSFSVVYRAMINAAIAQQKGQP